MVDSTGNYGSKVISRDTIVCVVGLGYVGSPLAHAFSRYMKVIGFDINSAKIDECNRKPDSEKSLNLILTDNPATIKQADFVIIAVPTPVTKSKDPDLSYIEGASRTVGRYLKEGAVVILESTVYPGVTEEVMVPVLESESGLKCGTGFKVGYSPERINPGDDEHALEKVTKVVAGMDRETTGLMVQLYEKVALHVYKARNIRTAEAAKVIENIQRDLNIALMNELALIFEKMGLKTTDVLEAAATKWNFHNYTPGLVGGHCIPVDPYYLVYKAKEYDYHAQLITAGRSINDYMPRHVAQLAIRALNKAGKVIKGSKVLIMGLTYKENVPDLRETPVVEMIHELKEFDIEVCGYDPVMHNGKYNFGIEMISDFMKLKNIDCIIITVAHDMFKEITLDQLRSIMNASPILIDIRELFKSAEARRKGIDYLTL